MHNYDINDEFSDWLEALENVLVSDGPEYASELLKKVISEAKNKGLNLEGILNPSFKNTITSDLEVPYPGDWDKEEMLRHLIRWNSLVMVLKANAIDDLGGHISTYASACTLYEVGFNHFFRGNDSGQGDLVYFQGHSSPGIYARSFLEGRITKKTTREF